MDKDGYPAIGEDSDRQDFTDEVNNAISGFNAMIDSYSNQSKEPNLNDWDSDPSATQRKRSHDLQNGGYTNQNSDLVDGKVGTWLEKNTELEKQERHKKAAQRKASAPEKLTQPVTRRRENINQYKVVAKE